MAFEIRCRELGHEECNWHAVSNTEDKLVDFVAVHARDHHGITDFTQEMIATVKNRLGTIVAEAGESEEEPVMREYHCTKCDWKYIAQTEDLIVDAVALHARDVHDVREFTKEMGHKVTQRLTDWQPAHVNTGCGCHCATN